MVIVAGIILFVLLLIFVPIFRKITGGVFKVSCDIAKELPTALEKEASRHNKK